MYDVEERGQESVSLTMRDVIDGNGIACHRCRCGLQNAWDTITDIQNVSGNRLGEWEGSPSNDSAEYFANKKWGLGATGPTDN